MSEFPQFPWQPPFSTTTPSVSSVRLLVRYGGTLRRFFNIAFTAGDASLYLFPYSRSGAYRYGVANMPPGSKTEINFDQGTYSDKTVKLSLHESGQIHIKVPGRPELGGTSPVRIASLHGQRGGHVATFHATHFAGTADHPRRKLKTGEFEHVLQVHDDEAGRVAVYVNAVEARFDDPCPIRIEMTRPTTMRPVHVGLRYMGHQPQCGPEQGQVIALSGPDPLVATRVGGKLVYSVALTEEQRTAAEASLDGWGRP